jgi:hypothetical protein
MNGMNYYKSKSKNELITIIHNLEKLLLKQYKYNEKKTLSINKKNNYLKTIYINETYSFPPKYKSWDTKSI